MFLIIFTSKYFEELIFWFDIQDRLVELFEARKENEERIEGNLFLIKI